MGLFTYAKSFSRAMVKFPMKTQLSRPIMFVSIMPISTSNFLIKSPGCHTAIASMGLLGSLVSPDEEDESVIQAETTVTRVLK